MVQFSLNNPLKTDQNKSANKEDQSIYKQMVERGKELIENPKKGGGVSRVRVQHSKSRMTIWERIKVLTNDEPNITYQNWGENLDGASIVTGILNIDNRDVAVYGHDFTLRAGSMDATNGAKLARLIEFAGRMEIPLIGMNDSAGAYVPAGVGGLDGYSEAFAAMRKISGVVPSIMLMFGYNAGGGAYLPRQGSYMIQPENTFFGLTGPGVVKQALGEDISADDLGGPKVHSQSGVVDVSVPDELGALRTALRLLSYLPDNNHSLSPFKKTSIDVNGYIPEEEILLEKTFSNKITGFNTPFDMRLLLQQIVDYGDYFELQPNRAKQLITAYGRISGHVVGFVANNSQFASGNINVQAAQKATRFIRFCNIYNIPLIFLEDVVGFAPGREQEGLGIVQEGRELLDAICDIRVPRLTMIIRNAFGGAYAAWNSFHVGADYVYALPCARIAVMGPAGVPFIYKEEYKKASKAYLNAIKEGASESEAQDIQAQMMVKLKDRYERELLNPEEALKLGSVSSLVMPGFSRSVLGNNLNLLMRHYSPSKLSSPHRE